MKAILPVVLLLLPISSAGEYFELHRDAYEVIFDSNNFTQQEKQAFRMQYEILALKDELLMELKSFARQKINNDKVVAIEQLVDKISQKMHQEYLFHAEMRKKNNDVFSLCADLLFAFTSAEKIDFESYLWKIRYWNSGAVKKLYFHIMRHTTVYQLEGRQDRNVFILCALEDSLLRNLKTEEMDDTEAEMPEIEYSHAEN